MYGVLAVSIMAFSKPSKKRKFNFLDTVEEEFQRKADCRDKIGDAIVTISSLSLEELKKARLPENIVLATLLLKYDYNLLESIRTSLVEVPEQFSSWRKQLVKERVIEVCPSASYRHELDAIIETVGTCCPEFIKFATKAFAPKRKFLAPPSFVCHECSGVLTANNPPSNICYYGLEGAIPGLKVDLRCRRCKINYGYTTYGNTEDGYRYYKFVRENVEASDVVYIDRHVAEYFYALRYYLAW